MRLRKDRRHLYESIEQGQQSDDGDYIPKDFADWREIPSQALERSELRDALIKALVSLPEKYREILVLRDVNHLSITETSQTLGLSEANVKTRLSRARLQMRDALASGLGGLRSGRGCEKVHTPKYYRPIRRPGRQDPTGTPWIIIANHVGKTGAIRITTPLSGRGRAGRGSVDMC